MPEDQQTLQQRINAHLQAKEWQPARVLLEEWLKRSPESVEAYFALGHVLNNLELYADAQLILQKAQRRRPNDKRISDALAYAEGHLPQPRPAPPAAVPVLQPAEGLASAQPVAVDPAPLPEVAPIAPVTSPPAPEPAPAAPALPTPAPTTQGWHAAIDGQTGGPYSLDELRRFVGTGQITPITLVWQEGMPQWVSLQDAPALLAMIMPTTAPTPAPAFTAPPTPTPTFTPGPAPTYPVSQPGYGTAPSTAPVMSVGTWFITLLLISIPMVGFILLLVWAFDGSNETRANYCKAALIFMVIPIVLIILAVIMIGAIGGLTAMQFS